LFKKGRTRGHLIIENEIADDLLEIGGIDLAGFYAKSLVLARAGSTVWLTYYGKLGCLTRKYKCCCKRKA